MKSDQPDEFPQPVTCLGILVADVVGRPVRSMPAPGRLVLVDEMSLHTGGCALNTATALARLGMPVEVIGKVGRDPLGDFVLNAMRERGIGVRGVSRNAMAGTSATMVMVDPDGERRFVHYLGANAHLTLDDVDRALITEATIFHVGGALVLPGLDGEPMAELLAAAREAAVTTVVDTVWDDTGRWMKTLAPCLPHVDYFIPNLAEAQALTGRDAPEAAASALLDRGVGMVVLKMGAAGCLAMSATETVRVPAFDVEVIDATGAGDAFVAGFIAGLLQDWPLTRVARFSNAVGACCVMGVGASGDVRSLPETLTFMSSTDLKRISS